MEERSTWEFDDPPRADALHVPHVDLPDRINLLLRRRSGHLGDTNGPVIAGRSAADHLRRGWR
jgi:hypothetical protein